MAAFQEQAMVISLEADVAKLQAGMAAARKVVADSVAEFSADARRSAAALEAIGDGGEAAARRVEQTTNAIIGDIQRTTAALQAGGKSSSEYYRIIAGQRGVDANALKPYLDQLDAASVKQGKAGISAAQMEMALRGLPAQFTDIATSIASGQQPLTVFMQQGGQLKDMFGGAVPAARALGGYIVGLVNPFAAVAAVAAAVGIAYHIGSQEADGYTKALIMTNRAVGVSADAMADMAARIDGTVGTQHAAAEALAALAGSGNVAGVNLERFASVAVDASDTIGMSLDDIARQFGDLAKEPLQAALKLDESMHFLTASTYEQIQALEKQGRTTEAANVAQTAYADTLASRTKEMQGNLGLIERSWNAIKNAAKEAGDAMLDIGRKSTLSEQIADKKIALARAQAHAGDFSQPSGLVDQLRNELAGLEADARRLQTDANRDAEREATRRAGIAAAKTLDEMSARVASNADKRKKEIEQYRRAVADLQAAGGGKEYTAARMAADEAKLADKYKDPKPHKAKDNSKALAREAEKYGDLLNKLSGISSSYNNDLERLNKAYVAGVLPLDRYREAVEELIYTQTDVGKATKAVDDYLAQSALARKESADQLAVEYQMYGKSADAREIAMVAVKAQADAEKKLAELRKAHLSVSQKQVDQINQEAEARAKAEQATQGQSKALGYAQQLADENRRFAAESIVDERERAQAILQIDAEMWQERIRLAGDGTKAQQELQAQFNTWYANQLNKPAIEEWKKSVEQYDNIFRQGFADMVNGGKDTWKSFTKSLTTTFKTSVVDQIYKMFAQPFVVKMVGSLLGVTGSGAAQAGGGSGMAGGTGGLGGVGDLLSSGKSMLDMFNSGTSSMSIGNMASGATQWFAESGIGSSMGLSEAGGLTQAGADAVVNIGNVADTVGTALSWAKVGYDVYQSFKTGEGWGATAGAAIGTYFLPGIGTVVGSTIGGLVDSAFGGGGAPKSGGNYNAVYGASGAVQTENLFGGYTPNQADAQVKQTLDAFNASYRELAALLGGTAQQLTANLGYDTDPEGDAGNRVSASVALGSVGVGMGNGEAERALWQQSLFKWVDQGVGEVDKGLSEAVARMMVAALQQSGLQQSYADILAGIDINTAPIDELNAAIERLKSLRQIDVLFDGMARVFPQLASAGLDARQAIVSFTGGLESLSSGMGSYYENFFSDSEKQARVMGEVSDALAKVGIVAPKTRAEFRHLVEGLDLTSEAGQKAYAAMMQVSGAFASVTDASTMAGSAELLSSLRDQVSAAYERESSAKQQLIDDLQRYISSLKSFRQLLLVGDLSTLSPEQKYAETRRQFEEVSALAAGGDKEAQEQLTGVAQQFLEASRTYNSTNEQYARDFDRVQGALDQQAAAANRQLSVAQQELSAMQDMVKGILDVNESMLSLSDAIKQYLAAKNGVVEQGAKDAATGNGGATSNASMDAVRQAYQQEGPDALFLMPGINDYSAKQSSAEAIAKITGQTVEQVWLASYHMTAQQFLEKQNNASTTWWDGATASKTPPVDGSHADGLAYVPFDGYIAELHRGERVLTAAENRHYALPTIDWSQYGRQDNAALVSEVRALREEVARLRTENREDAQAGRQQRGAIAGAQLKQGEALTRQQARANADQL